MGAGEVGSFLARRLSSDGHAVVVIDEDPDKQRIVEEQLDVAFVLGNGSEVPALTAADVAGCDLFVAASSSDSANLAASLLAKTLGAPRSVVRVHSSEDITRFGRVYEKAFQADLLLSTQLLTTTLILNRVLGYNTLDIEYLASGELQVRRIAVEEDSVLAQRALRDVRLPRDTLVLAFVSESSVTVPRGSDRAQPGDEVLVIGTPEALGELERRVSRQRKRAGFTVIAGGGDTAAAVIEALASQAGRIKLFEKDRTRAEKIAARFPHLNVVHGDVTDASLLASEGVRDAAAFIALTGNDETNLMACLIARELGVTELTALVQKTETSNLWARFESLDIVSPRNVAAKQIVDYIESGYSSHVITFEGGQAQYVERTVYAASPVVDEELRHVQAPAGILVAGVLRDGKAMIPRGDAILRVGDRVILFVHRNEIDVVRLLFPGSDDV